jgi:exopolysaccharide biosynthesis WecB/TagA/CpsF family protein
MKAAPGGFPTHAFLGIEFARCGMADALAWIGAAARGDRFAYVVTPNVDHVVMVNASGDEPWRRAYREAVERSDLCLNDSRVLARLARLSKIDLGLVPGSDLTPALIGRGIAPGASVALVGGEPREADFLRAVLPEASVAHLSPPMGVRDDPALHDAIAEFVERERADFVFLAMGAPQSEIVARHIAARGRARGVGLCIGASIEFLSGTRRRAPRWMQRLSIEWLFRLLSEPGRLWRRYLVEGPRVFGIWWRQSRR